MDEVSWLADICCTSEKRPGEVKPHNDSNQAVQTNILRDNFLEGSCSLSGLWPRAWAIDEGHRVPKIRNKGLKPLKA